MDTFLMILTVLVFITVTLFTIFAGFYLIGTFGFFVGVILWVIFFKIIWG